MEADKFYQCRKFEANISSSFVYLPPSWCTKPKETNKQPFFRLSYYKVSWTMQMKEKINLKKKTGTSGTGITVLIKKLINK